MRKSYIPVVARYMFSNKKVEDFTECERMVIDYHIDCITSHGMGGKAMERFNDYKFGFTAWNDKIHDFDSRHQDSRPIEQKLETVNDSKKLQFCGSFFPTPNRVTKFQDQQPYMLNTAVCDKTGKVLWVALTDTNLIPEDSEFWKNMSANAPRISFACYSHYPESVNFLYVNKQLCKEYKMPTPDRKTRNSCIATDVWNLLLERKYVNA